MYVLYFHFLCQFHGLASGWHRGRCSISSAKARLPTPLISCMTLALLLTSKCLILSFVKFAVHHLAAAGAHSTNVLQPPHPRMLPSQSLNEQHTPDVANR